MSCLCVTEDREAFLPWLFWNYRKQDHEPRELVIVDSSRVPLTSGDPGVTVVRCPPGTTVARKRNLALEAARGRFVTWFDDDDWQHPRKLSILAAALGEDAVLAGARRSWFVDVYHERARRYETSRGVIFNGLAVRRSALADLRFDERLTRAADTDWQLTLRRRLRYTARVVPEILSWWLCHTTNLSNPLPHHGFPDPLADVSRAVGTADWADTDRHLAALRNRLGTAAVTGP